MICFSTTIVNLRGRELFGKKTDFLPLPSIAGIGVDIIEIDRIRNAAESIGERFLNKIFTPEERNYCDGRHQAFASYAARFAAKEAVLKALGTGVTAGTRFSDVEVFLTAGGVPGVKLHNNAAKLAEQKKIPEILLSLSHDQSKAIAFAVALKHGE